MSNGGKSFLWGIALGIFVSILVGSSASESSAEKIQWMEDEHREETSVLESKISDLESELSEAKSCINGLKTMTDRARYGISSVTLSLSTRDDEYETLYDAIEESKDGLSSIELSGIPGDCFPGFINP